MIASFIPLGNNPPGFHNSFTPASLPLGNLKLNF